MPFTETVSSRPLRISPTQNRRCDILLAKKAGLVNRHYHPFAFVFGASLARDTSFVSGHLREGKRAHVASYFTPELTLDIPSQPHWDLMIRYHHRSNIWGVLPQSGDSQFWTMGVRLRF